MSSFFLLFGVNLNSLHFSLITMAISFQRQLQEDDNNAITAEYDLYSDDDDYDSIERQGRAEEGE